MIVINNVMCIFSTDAVVGLKAISADILESVGSVEVCAAVLSPGSDCTIDLAFNIHFRTVNDSAGTIHQYLPLAVIVSIMSSLISFSP